jgi:Zn-dependent protease
MLPLWFLVFLLSVTCHEAAHAWMAWIGGDSTAYLGGQVSLNPWPHVQREPVGTLVVPLLTYVYAGWMMGWASAPYDPYWEDRHPRRAAAMAAAGPFANLALAGIAFTVLKVGLLWGAWLPPTVQETGQIVYRYSVDRLVLPASGQGGLVDGLGRFCSVLLTLNLVLFVFNMIPMPPMDGASIVSGLFEPARRLRERIRSAPMAGLVGLVIAWYGFRYLFNPIYRPVLLMLWG